MRLNHEQRPTLHELVCGVSCREVIDAATRLGIVRKSRKPSNLKKIIIIKRYIACLKRINPKKFMELDNNEPLEQEYVDVELTINRKRREHYYDSSFSYIINKALTQKIYSYRPVEYNQAELVAAIINSRLFGSLFPPPQAIRKKAEDKLLSIMEAMELK